MTHPRTTDDADRHAAVPAIPRGRRIELHRRGTTFVRTIKGPPGAPTVVLLHGLAATAALNWHQVFEPLSEHFRVIAPDLRGHGRGIRSASSVPARRLRRRRGRDPPRPRRRPGHRRRLLDGRPGGPADVAGSPRRRERHGAVRDRRRVRPGEPRALRHGGARPRSWSARPVSGAASAGCPGRWSAGC